MKLIIKYWAQITGVLTVIGLLLLWVWRIASKVEEGWAKQQQIETRLTAVEKQSQDNDETLDDHNGQLIKLNTIEDLREKNICR